MSWDPEAFAHWEPHIKAFVRLSEARAMRGPLNGLSVGVKDIIDVAGLPTRNGSAACADAPPAAKDAPVVAALRAGGARIVGKTVTTEFAFTDPTGCRNPHDLTRSPGGSSSGSGAAVAAGLVDIALGTQTAGSLCRPAAYSGVVGLKTSYGALSRDGVTPLAPSFDSVGVIARSVDLARRAFTAMSGQAVDGQGMNGQGMKGRARRAVTWLLPDRVSPTPDAMAALDAAQTAISDLCQSTQAPPVPLDTTALIEAHRIVMLAEAAAAHGALLTGASGAHLQPNFKAALVAGLALTEDEVQAARSLLHAAAERFWNAMQDVDFILTLPVPEGAPKLGDSTGFQGWLTVWTVFGGPLVSLPWGLDGLGRPRAVMLAGRPGADLALLDLAAQLERAAPAMPAPVPPAR